MNMARFISAQIEDIKKNAGTGLAINALSGGVDSAVCTVLGHRALGRRLKTFMVDNALMREGEPQYVVKIFKNMGIPVQLVDARKEFLQALKGLTDPEEKRHAITNTFYKKVFGRLVRKTGARHLVQGTILTDIEETVAGIKRQHNILSQLGIDTRKAYGYHIIEPLKTLRKDDVRKAAIALGLPKELAYRIPFPGPALATRIIGEVTEANLDLIRKATAIVEDELSGTKAFQYLAVLMNDRATGIRNNKREFGRIIAVRCIHSKDGRKATAVHLPLRKLDRICKRIVAIPGVTRCLYDLTPKPPATVEYI